MVLAYLAILIFGIFFMFIGGFNLIVIAVSIASGLYAKAPWQVLAAAFAGAVLTMLLGSGYAPDAFFVGYQFVGAFGAGCLLGFGVYYVRQRYHQKKAADLL